MYASNVIYVSLLLDRVPIISYQRWSQPTAPHAIRRYSLQRLLQADMPLHEWHGAVAARSSNVVRTVCQRVDSVVDSTTERQFFHTTNGRRVDGRYVDVIQNSISTVTIFPSHGNTFTFS